MSIRTKIILSLLIVTLGSILLAWCFFMALESNTLGAAKAVMLFIVLTTLIIAVAGEFLARSISTPVLKMIAVTEGIKGGNLSQKIDISAQNEIGQLARALNDMVDSLARQTEALQESNMELLQQTHFLDTVLHHIPTMVFVKEAADLRFTLFNRASGELLGLDPATMPGKTDFDFWPAEQAAFFVESDRATLREGKLIDIPEEPITSRHNGTRWLHTKKVPVMDKVTGKPRYLVGISEDITERKELIDKLAESNAELERFAYIAAHDLQEPLRMISSFSELLAKNYGDKLGEEGLEYIRFCVDGSRRMQELVHDLLEYSRLGSDAERYEAVNCNNILRIVLDNLGERIGTSGAKVTYEDLPVIQANPVRVIRLLQNLVGNGLKYQVPGNAPLIHVGIEDKGLEWRFSVRDNGIGIKKEYQKQIFEPFKRLHGKYDYPGTGMGLAITQKIVEGMGGKIWVESEEDKGCVFYFTVPKEHQGKKSS